MENLIPEQALIVDLETSVKNRGEDAVGKQAGSPHHPDNEIVMSGHIVAPSKHELVLLTRTIYMYENRRFTLVGHNVKFDLLYMLKQQLVHKLENMVLWDTMIVEYLLSGQTRKFCSLDMLSEKYGGTKKDEKIKEYWDSGMDTEDIPKSELEEYLKHDVLNTRLIYLEQRQKAEKLGMMPLIYAQMQALKATTVMEYHGMKFDIFKALDESKGLMEKARDLTERLTEAMIAGGIKDPNPMSNDHVSLYLFGGDQKYIDRVRVLDSDGNPVVYKSGIKKGEYKYKNVEVVQTILRCFTPKKEWETSKKGIYRTGDDVLQEYADYYWVRNLLELRMINKDLNTYFVGYAKLMWPHDECIHGTINHCSTATGRMSSANPNLQNLSGKD